MHIDRTFLSLSAIAFVALACAGCAEDGKVTVEGVARLDGQPIVRGNIRFLHEGNGPTATAMIENGRYQSRMIVGKKRVEIEGFEVSRHMPADPVSGAPAYDAWRQVVPKRYNSASELMVEVGAAAAPVDFDLTSP